MDEIVRYLAATFVSVWDVLLRPETYALVVSGFVIVISAGRLVDTFRERSDRQQDPARDHERLDG